MIAPHWRYTLRYFSAFFVLGAGVAALGPTLPALAVHLGVDIDALSGLFSARSLGYLGGSLAAGWLYDRFPGHRVLAVMLGMLAAALFFIPQASGILWLAVLVWVNGLALGGLDVGSNMLMSWTHGPRSGPFLTAMFFFAGVGSTLTPLFLDRALLGGELAGLRLGYGGLALLALPVLLWVWFAPPAARPAPHPAGETAPGRLYTPLALVGLLFFVYVGVEVSFGGWLYTFALQGVGIPAAEAARLTAAFWLAITLGRLAAVPLALQFSSKDLIWANILVAVGSLGLLLLGSLAWLEDAPSAAPAWLWLAALGLGAALASMYPNTLALVSSKIPLSGSVAGILWALGSCGAMLLPWLAGESLARSGPAMLALLLFGVALFSLGVFVALLAALRALPPRTV